MIAIPDNLSEALQDVPMTDMDAARPKVLALVSAWLKVRQTEARERFEREGHAHILVRQLSAAMDEVIRALTRLLVPNAHGFTVVATGGYGRAEMFPHSDIDLLFIYRPAARKNAEHAARFTLYILWDLGLKVGHALRQLEETLELAAEDLTIRTNLLDSRLVTGDNALFTEFTQRFRAEQIAPNVPAFVEAKLNERDERLHRFGDSRFLLEPNMKEGKGGLRDLHTLYWLARAAYGVDDIGELVTKKLLSETEYATFRKAQNFLWELRAHLHYLAGKADERLTFDRQPELALRMGYHDRLNTRAVERLMKRYFLIAANVGSLTRIFCAILEEAHQRRVRRPLAHRLHDLWRLDGFTLVGDRLSTKSEEDFAREPARMLKLFAFAQAHAYDIHPRALQQVAHNLHRVRALQDDAEANAIFLKILLSNKGPEQTLKRMNEVGLLGRFIPDFGRVVGQMQFNMYHIYTVDEHTLVALGNLFSVEQGKQANDVPIASKLAKRISSRKVLYLALLCHDLAKGRGGDHSELGMEVARRLALRLGFTQEEAELAAWLVQYHLLFTHTAFKRDINDPQTIRDFVGVVQTTERLKLLLLLTVADVRAVAPNVWNAWKAALLRNLYTRAEELITTGALSSGEWKAGDLRGELMSLLPSWDAQQIEAYLALLPADLAAGQAALEHARLATLLTRRQAEQMPLLVETEHDRGRGITEIWVITPDSHALFSKLAGALAMVNANIVGAKIFTLANGIAVDMFQVQDEGGQAFERADKLARLSVRMEQALSGEIDITKELAKQKPSYATRRDAFKFNAQVYVDNAASATHTVIEVTGRDRVGFLYAVTRALSEQGLMIGSAHISTYGAQAVDVFYVKDVFGMKVGHEQKVEQIKAAVMAAASD